MRELRGKTSAEIASSRSHLHPKRDALMILPKRIEVFCKMQRYIDMKF
jgi:hypothetical protein